MAKGRFLSKEITVDKKVHDLQSVYCKLAWSWLIPHLDVEGRIHGDPSVLRSTIMPREKEVTDEMMESFIKEWHDKEMIVWYEVDGDKYIQCLNFEKHQSGIRKDRESPSIIPPIPAEKLRRNSGKTPAQIPVKLSEVKLSEVKDEVEVLPRAVSGGTKLINQFLEITGLKLVPNEIASWRNALIELEDSGVTESIMRQAVQEMTEKNYKIVSPKSIVKACQVILGHNARKSTESTRKRDSDGQYSEFINH